MTQELAEKPHGLAEGRVVEIIPVGTQVMVDGTTPARVLYVIIREHEVAYECVWWKDGQRNSSILESWEVQPEGDIEKLRVNSIL